MLDKLLLMDPSQVRAWTDQTLQDGGGFAATFNWHMLADAAGENARSMLDLGWAETAIHVYEYLAHSHEDSEGSPYMLSSMHLRGFMIRELGPGEGVLDPQSVFSWFSSSHQDLDAIKLEIALVQQLDDEQLSKHKALLLVLRRIKNQLAVLQEIATNPMVTIPPSIVEWLHLGSQLP